ncbi:Beta-glucosidase 32 [Zea mays]|uniref:Beta-glucosidase 32 n=1 Tax=Zea mays TaxID=4577 RepID=A0A1D6E8I7_MAIZE|nr:Beta-glucosidase 32 [Zea mays]
MTRLLLLSLLLSVAAGAYDGAGQPPISRRSFPEGFIFGASSASYQYEGGVTEGRRGPSIWDTYTHQHPGMFCFFEKKNIFLPPSHANKIIDRSNGDLAIDSYHLYKEDVRLLKDMGMDAYRFSISWTRILPNGSLSGGINKEGIRYYNNLINELLLKAFCSTGYASGVLAPGRCSPWEQAKCSAGDSGREPYTVCHHQLLAHAEAVHLYKEKYQASQRGKIGVTLNSLWFLPSSPSKSNDDAVRRALDFMLGWFMDPLVSGDYPASMRRLAASFWLFMYPDGFRELLLYIKENYGNPTIYITENGFDEANNMSLPLHEALKDDTRIEYHHKHLLALLSAIRDGANVKGYFVWSLLDNFEWVNGYTVRFGLNFVDYNDGLKRYPKNSAHWFKEILRR